MRDLFSQFKEQDKQPIQELLYPTSRVADCYNTVDQNLASLALNPSIAKNNSGIVQYITEQVRSKIESQKVQKKFSDVRDDFYDKFTNPLVEQKVVSDILTPLQKNYPHITFFEPGDPYVKKCLSKYKYLSNYSLSNTVEHYLERQEGDFAEIRSMIFMLSRDSKIRKALISGGQNIVDVASGRGELALSLMYETYLMQLEAVGLPANADPNDAKEKFLKRGIKGNTIITLDPCDYSDDTRKLIEQVPELQLAASFNTIQSFRTPIKKFTMPESAIVMGHRLCGTLVEDTINSATNSKAKAIAFQGCCLYKAKGERPPYGLSQEDWNKLCLMNSPELMVPWFIKKELDRSSVKAITSMRTTYLKAIGYNVALTVKNLPIICASQKTGIVASFLDFIRKI